jgi:hypothetical protein
VRRCCTAWRAKTFGEFVETPLALTSRLGEQNDLQRTA